MIANGYTDFDEHTSGIGFASLAQLKAALATTGSPASLDADGGIAVFTRLQEIYAVNLATGKTKLLATAGDKEQPQVAIEPAGVVYYAGGRIVDVPRAVVETMLGR